MMSSAVKIAQLSELLRNSGDKLLNGDQYKLTLSGQLVQALCDALRPIVKVADKPLDARPFIRDSNQFRVVSNEANCELTAETQHDLRLIFDFVQKTRVLCVTEFTTEAMGAQNDGHNNSDDGDSVNIAHFRNLRRLEISSLSVFQVRGIGRIRAHLHELKCVQSIDSVADIIAHCGGDRCSGFTWNRLHTVDLSYNSLRTVDNSLELVTVLQHLNLSHNLIESLDDAIQWLPHLQHLDLAYNRLTQVPRLHGARGLKVLKLAGNHIEYLRLPRLKALEVLDLSDNFVLEETALLPLGQLVFLHALNLSGNPIACQPRYRSATAKCLDQSAAKVNFLLDNEPLSKSERTLLGQQCSILIASRRRCESITPSISTSVYSSIGGSVISLNLRKRPPRCAAIAEYTPDFDSTATADVMINRQLQPSLDLKLCCKEDDQQPHLVTKKRIEKMRQQLGERWLLQPDSGLTTSSMPDVVTPIVCDWESEPTSPEWVMNYPLLSHQQICEASIASTDDTDRIVNISGTLDHNSDLESPEMPEDNRNNFVAVTKDFVCDDEEDHQSPSDVETDALTYSVILQPSMRPMLLVLSDTCIRERDDALGGRTVTKWCMSMLDSCDRLRANVLRLQFDTLNRNRRERIYRLETERLGQQVEQFLRNILEQRPLFAMNQALYRCVKCDVTFVHETSTGSGPSVRCPQCNSQFLVEINETHSKRLSRPADHPIHGKISGASYDDSVAQPFTFSYVDFDEVDHRLKLHLYQNVFEDDDEQLEWLVRGQILLDGPGVAICGPALFVATKMKFYVLRIIGLECDDVSKWVKPHLAGSIDLLLAIQVLPLKIGVAIRIKGVGNLNLMLQDVKRTENMLLFLANHQLSNTCFVKYQPDQEINHNLLRLTGDELPKSLNILSKFSWSSNSITGESPPQKMLGLIVTETNVYLLNSSHRWLNAGETEPCVLQKQSLVHLVRAERLAEHVLRLTFADRNEQWTCTFGTADNASGVLALIQLGGQGKLNIITEYTT